MPDPGTWTPGPNATEGDDVYEGANVVAGALELVHGLGGNDTMRGNGGDDELHGDAGNDTLDGGRQDDFLYGGDGDDTLYGDGSVVDRLTDFFSDHHDYIEGGAGDDFIDGGASADRLVGGDGADEIYGGGGNDILTGGAGIDFLYGEVGNDQLTGDASDTLAGGAGDDLYLSASILVELAGEGTDTLRIAAGATLADYVENLDMTAAMSAVTGVGNAGNNSILGGIGNDTLSGLDGADTLNGGGGDDLLIGGSGPGGDLMAGGAGSDTSSYASAATGVYFAVGDTGNQTGDAAQDVISGVENLIGSAFNDILSMDGNANQIRGGDGADQLYGQGGDDVLEGGAGGDVLFGGSGVDRASYAAAAAGVYVFLGDLGNATGEAAGDVLVEIEGLIGSGFNDILGVSDGANTLDGGAGADQLYGLGGDDTLIGGAGGDVLLGGDGADTVSYATASAGVYAVIGDFGSATGDAAGDAIFDVENVTGSAFDDILGWGDGANIVNGGFGNDQLYGMGGDDVLIGGMGADLITGGDVLNGGDGFDTVSYETSTTGVYAVVGDFGHATGEAKGDVYVSIERLLGSAFDDVLALNSGNDVVDGGAGNDRLYGFDGNDTLNGGSQADFLFGGDGDDILSGVASLQNGLVGQANGGNGNDTITGSGILRGDAGDDVIVSQGTFDIWGGAGADRIVVTAFTGVRDFEDNLDVIDLRSLSGASPDSWTMQQLPGRVLIEVAGVNILLYGATTAQISDADFIFPTS